MFNLQMESTNWLDDPDPLMTFRGDHLLRASRRNLRHHQASHGCAPHIRHLFSSCSIGFWNVRTLRHSFIIAPDGSLETAGDEAYEVLKQRMLDHRLYALALSETRIAGSGSASLGGGFTLIWSGSDDNDALGGVAFLLSPGASLAWRRSGSQSQVLLPGRLLAVTLALAGTEGSWQLVATYGPTLQQSDAVRNRFFAAVEAYWRETPSRVVSFMIGDWNCRVGRHTPDNAWSPPNVLGPHGLGQCSATGRRLLQLAAAWELKILTGFFIHDLQHTATWTHPRWHTPGVIDLAVSRQNAWPFVQNVRVVPGAEFDTDHKLVVLHLRAAPCRGGRQAAQAPASNNGGPARLPRLNVAALQDPAVRAAFNADLATRLVGPGQAVTFDSLSRALREAGVNTLGLQESTQPDWRQGNERVLRELATSVNLLLMLYVLHLATRRRRPLSEKPDAAVGMWFVP